MEATTVATGTVTIASIQARNAKLQILTLQRPRTVLPLEISYLLQVRVQMLANPSSSLLLIA